MANTIAALEAELGIGKPITADEEGVTAIREFSCGCTAVHIMNGPFWNVVPCIQHLGEDWT